MKTYHLVSFGEALIDFTPTKDGAYYPNAGGAPFNLAVCAAKYGCGVAFIGKVGNDAFGKLLRETAIKHGVCDKGMVFDSSRVTTHAFLTLSDSGERDFVFCREHGADTAITVEDIDKKLITAARCFHFGGLSLSTGSLKQACLHAVKAAREGGCIISFDPNYRAPLWQSEKAFCNEVKEVLPLVDILKVSEEEAAIITGEADINGAVKALSAIPLVLITKGKNGAVCSIHGKAADISGYKADTVDTTGAGDIFFGVFLSQLLLSPQSIAELNSDVVRKYCDKACYYAAKSTEKYGAIPSIPNFSS